MKPPPIALIPVAAAAFAALQPILSDVGRIAVAAVIIAAAYAYAEAWNHENP